MKKRLFSLDVLRGFDMLLLLYGSTLVWEMQGVPWWPRWMLTQFSHPWGVFTLFDIIQPLFAFVCGAAVPLALKRRMVNGKAGREYWTHVAVRFVELIFLGMLCSGFLRFSIKFAPFFGNTLQLLAFGYVFGAICYAYIPRKAWLPICGGLLVAWGVALALGGDMTPDGNLSAKIERFMTGLLVPGKTLAKVTFTSWGTIPMFCALTVLGAYALGFLQDESRSEKRRANSLMIAGLALIVVGVLVHFFLQVQIKHIYTPAYTLICGGISLFLLGAFYWIFDILGVRRGTWLCSLYGRHALAAYMFWSVFGWGIKHIAKETDCHFQRLVMLPEMYYPIFNMCVTLFLFTYLLWLWSLRKRIK